MQKTGNNLCDLPADFLSKMKGLLGEEWNLFLDSYENGRHQALRFNTLKKGLAAELYPELLAKLQITKQITVPWARDAFYYAGEECQPGKHPYHEMGLYYIQEPSAMSAAELLDPQPGERVLDLCAAPGGKTTQIASAMGGQGLLVANEIHPARAKILSQNIERMGIANVIVTNEDSGKLAETFGGFFHRILVDAPCSGEGMFRKNPEAAQEWSPDGVKHCAVRQLEILEHASGMLMPGGILVYSTCTFSPEENEQVIGTFLEKHPEYTVEQREAPYFGAGHPEWGNGNPDLAGTFRLWPHKLSGEGHYAAVLRKAGEPLGTDVSEKIAAGGRKTISDSVQWSSFQEFSQSILMEDMESFLIKSNLTLFGEQLYRLPAGAPSLSGIRVLRAGLHIGTFKKKRFEPSHALALFLGRNHVKHSVELKVEDPAAAAYFRGETIPVRGEKGWQLVCVDGFSAGWGKLACDTLKNHYPKGLRR